MLVKELIAKLQTMDQDALVLTRGYEDGYDPANNDGPFEETVYPARDPSWYNGKYDIITKEDDKWSAYDQERYDLSTPVKVVII